MFSSEDEQDDNGIFDQLKSIRPFTAEQLYLLHPDVGCPDATQDDIDKDVTQDIDVYQNLYEYEQLRDKLSELRNTVKKVHKKTFDHVDKVWIFKEESTRKIAMCQSGKIAETTFKYKQAVINKKQLEIFSLGFNRLSEIISKDYIYYSFEGQMKLNRIATQLSLAYQMPNKDERKVKLKSAITTLIEFLRNLGESKSDFVVQCRKWLRSLSKKYLEAGTTDDYRFIVAQIARGPVGTADWTADLIECKPFDQVSGFESVPQYITHCSALLRQLFHSLKPRVKRACSTSDDNAEAGNQNWSFVHPSFNCIEELNVTSSSSNVLSEADVIKLCLKIPIPQIFRNYVKRCLASDEFCLETDKNYEYIMLKLLTIGTIIIKTYQIGLETFNSILYGNLIEYLSSQIKCTVVILSDQWTEFKSRLRGVDDALLMRLQVEYDNFILRSILIILELRESGIWRHLSRLEPDTAHESEDGHHGWTTDSLRPAFNKLLQVTGLSSPQTTSADQQSKIPVEKSSGKNVTSGSRSSRSLTYEFSTEWFREVSEPMLWHILWQFYHNAFTSSCDYHSDNYWLEKFQENSVVYLFVKKIRDSPPGECSYLINSITSILLSRTRPDSKIVQFLATEIFNLSFKNQEVHDKVTKKGTKSLIRCAKKFPSLISVYLSLMVAEEVHSDVVELFKESTLSGWLSNDEEMDLIASWLVEFPLNSTQSRVARLIISKLLLNSPETRQEPASQSTALHDTTTTPVVPKRTHKPRDMSTPRKPPSNKTNCFVDLKLRRRIALLLYEASVHHLPQDNEFGPHSLGASVEVAFGGLYCDLNTTVQCNLIDLAVDSSYQQFYVWSWRLLFTLRLHILNLPETDWNDVQSRSGTSRSIKNTVLVNDTFHPAPSIQDSECLSLSVGVKNQNPIASYIYLVMTDATWQTETLDSCLQHLNVLVNTGHLTPSLMAMKFLTICHLNDLTETVIKDRQILDYFTAIITSNYDATSLASLIVSQLDKLKQFRQLQLSQFYINLFLEVASIVAKQISSSWFSSNEISLEKIACLLDYIVRFNFPTQRLEIIRKFYDCSYSIQATTPTTGWFGSFFSSNSLSVNSTKREFFTNLHALTQKFKKYFWLRWITTECDALRLEKIWEDIVSYLSSNETADLDAAIRKVCPQLNGFVLKSMLPIYSWIKQIFDLMESDLNHPLCPLIWYNFFLNYFANSLNGVSVGYKLVPQETIIKLMARLDSLFNYHLYKHRNWASTSGMQQNSLAQLYRAYKLWLQDPSLREAYVDIDRLKPDYSVALLKAIMESSTEGSCLQYIDLQSVETQNRNLIQVWTKATRLNEDHLLTKEIVFVDSQADESMKLILSNPDEEASDAVSLLVKSQKESTLSSPPQQQQQQQRNEKDHHNGLAHGSNQELDAPICEDIIDCDRYRSLDELIELIKRNFALVFEESTMFELNLTELEKNRNEINELVQQLYSNKRREFVQVAPCIEGDLCPGPAKIRIEAEEALLDERKSQCIQDRRRQCQELVNELIMMPKNRTVQSTTIIEENVKRLMGDSGRSKTVIELLLGWISEPDNYKKLNGPYYAASHLFKQILELLSNTSTSDSDTYNRALIDVCLKHPDSVQILSPYWSPTSCSSECFLELYKIISSSQQQLGPMAMFVLLSKFDINSWLTTNSSKNKEMYHNLIEATCLALRNMGKQCDDASELTFDLFRRHLQIELSPPDRRRPEELSLVVSRFLPAMDEQQLAPSLWLDLLTMIGLERNVNSASKHHRLSRVGSSSRAARSTCGSLDESSTTIGGAVGGDHNNILPASNELDEATTTIVSTIENVARLADSQAIFDYHSLTSLIQMLSNFLEKKHEELNDEDITLLELYQAYLDQFSVVLLSVTFMWLKSISEQYPDNHELIWKQFTELWNNWILLKRNCQNVGKSSYTLMANYFVASIRYMIYRLPDNSQTILQSTLLMLANYIKQTKQVVYLELTILQRCLKNLPWSSLIAGPDDFEQLASLSEQENYNISDLVSHIILQMDTKESLNRIYQANPTQIPRVVERLATTIILHSTSLKGFRLHGRYFSMIQTESIPRLAQLILGRMEFVNLEHSQNNKLLVNLLRFMCIKMELGLDGQPTSSPKQQQVPNNHITSTTIMSSGADESFNRSLIYAQFVSNYLIDLIKRHPTVVRNNKTYLLAVMENSLQDLKLLNSPELDLHQKTTLYENLLECCSSDLIDSEARLLLARALVDSTLLKNRPIVVLEILHAVGHILRDGQILVYMIEILIDLYLNMNGHYEKVWKCFSLKVLPSDIYLNACIEERSPMAMLVYFESLTRGNLMTSSQLGANENQDQASNCDSLNSMASSEHSHFNQARIWSSFFHWLARLTEAIDVNNMSELLDAKLAALWLRTLDMLEHNLEQFVLGDHQGRSLIRSAIKSEKSATTTTTATIPNDENHQSEVAAGQDEKQQPSGQQAKHHRQTIQLLPSHKCLLELIKQLISLYDSVNSGGLWSYLRATFKNEQSIRISVTAISVACFLADRTLLCLSASTAARKTSEQQQQQQPSSSSAAANNTVSGHLSLLREEATKLRKSCLGKLEAARKSKSFVECHHYLETLIESVQHNDKVQYREGLQLITTFVRLAYSGQLRTAAAATTTGTASGNNSNMATLPATSPNDLAGPNDDRQTVMGSGRKHDAQRTLGSIRGAGQQVEQYACAYLGKLLPVFD